MAKKKKGKSSVDRVAKKKEPKKEHKKKEEKLFVDGKVVAALPNRYFRVELENEQRILGYLSGKMTKNYIRVTLGDRVRVELSPYDLTKGRIVFRYQK